MHATIRKKLARGAGAAVAAVGLFAMTPPATAGPCGVRDEIIKQLADIHKERRSAIGLMTSGEVLEIFVSPSGGWTAVVSSPIGWGCIVAAGEAWMQVPLPLGPDA